MPWASAQAKGAQSCIYVHIAAGAGKIVRGFHGSGEMWIAISATAKGVKLTIEKTMESDQPRLRYQTCG